MSQSAANETPDVEVYAQQFLDYPDPDSTEQTREELRESLEDYYTVTLNRDPALANWKIARTIRQAATGAIIGLIKDDLLTRVATTYGKYGSLVVPGGQALEGEVYDITSGIPVEMPLSGSAHQFCMVLGSLSLASGERVRRDIEDGDSPYKPLWEEMRAARTEYDKTYAAWRQSTGKSRMQNYRVKPDQGPVHGLKEMIKNNIGDPICNILLGRAVAMVRDEGVTDTASLVTAARKDAATLSGMASVKGDMMFDLEKDSPLERLDTYTKMPPDERPANAYGDMEMPMAFPNGTCPYKRKEDPLVERFCFARLRTKATNPEARVLAGLLFEDIGWEGLNPERFSYGELSVASGILIAKDTIYKDLPGIDRTNA